MVTLPWPSGLWMNPAGRKTSDGAHVRFPRPGPTACAGNAASSNAAATHGFKPIRATLVSAGLKGLGILDSRAWTGKAAAWLIMGLMLLVCAEVFKRYILNMPTAWIFDASNMMYGTLFMIGGAYTLAQNGHVRGDFLYSSMRPRTPRASA